MNNKNTLYGSVLLASFCHGRYDRTIMQNPLGTLFYFGIHTTIYGLFAECISDFMPRKYKFIVPAVLTGSGIYYINRNSYTNKNLERPPAS